MAITSEEVKIRLGVDGSALGRGLESVSQKMSGWARGVGASMIGYLSISTLISQFDKLGQKIDSIKRISEKTGLDAGLIQDLINVGNAAGIGGQEVEGMLDMFVKKLKPGEDAGKKIRDLADALSKTSDAGERAALAVEAFGNAGIKMIPILSQGSEAVDKLAESMGRLSKEELDEIDQLNDTLDITKSKADVFLARIIASALFFKGIIKTWKDGTSFFDKAFFIPWLGSENAKEMISKYFSDSSDAAVKAANDAFDATEKARVAAIREAHFTELSLIGSAAAWLEKKDRERTKKRASDVEKLKILEEELADMRGDLGNMDGGNTAMEIANMRNLIAEKENEIADLKAKTPAGSWTAFAGDPRKESQAKYYEKVGKSLGPVYGKAFTDRAASLRDSEWRETANGIQKQIIGEGFFEALEKSKTTPQSVIIKGVEGE